MSTSPAARPAPALSPSCRAVIGTRDVWATASYIQSCRGAARWDGPEARRVRDVHGGWGHATPVSVPATSDQYCEGTSGDGGFSNGAQSKRSEQILKGKQRNHWTDGRRKHSGPGLRSLPTSYYDGSAAAKMMMTRIASVWFWLRRRDLTAPNTHANLSGLGAWSFVLEDCVARRGGALACACVRACVSS